MNRAVFDALRPGGIYGIIDHSARPGTGTADVQTLHRIDEPTVVPRRSTAAGFQFVGDARLPAQPRRSPRLERLAARGRRQARHQRSLRAEVRRSRRRRARIDRRRDPLRRPPRRGEPACAAAGGSPDGAAFADWAGAADEVDWDWVVRTARAHKLWALVAARLSASGVDVAVGGDLPQRVAAVRTEAARRGAMSERTLAAVADAFAAARLPFYVVKGSVLAHRVYGDPHLRRFADVDRDRAPGRRAARGGDPHPARLSPGRHRGHRRRDARHRRRARVRRDADAGASTPAISPPTRGMRRAVATCCRWICTGTRRRRACASTRSCCGRGPSPSTSAACVC